MKYEQFKTWLSSNFIPAELPFIYPGPDDPDLPAGRVVVLTRVGGPGLQLESMFDAVGWQVKAIGLQGGDYQSAEDLALDLDAFILSAHTQTLPGADPIRLLSATRTGDPPVPLLVDDADRTHFVCSYILTVQSTVALT